MGRLLDGILIIGLLVGGIFILSRVDFGQIAQGSTGGGPAPTTGGTPTSGYQSCDENTHLCKCYQNTNYIQMGANRPCSDCQTICTTGTVPDVPSTGGSSGGKSCQDFGGKCNSECDPDSSQGNRLDCLACNAACGTSIAWGDGGGGGGGGSSGGGGGGSSGGGGGGGSSDPCGSFTGYTACACRGISSSNCNPATGRAKYTHISRQAYEIPMFETPRKLPITNSGIYLAPGEVYVTRLMQQQAFQTRMSNPVSAGHATSTVKKGNFSREDAHSRNSLPLLLMPLQIRPRDRNINRQIRLG